MLLRYWTAIVFSLWVSTPSTTQQDSGSSSQCQIRADPDPQYVAAYLMHYQPGRGCYFNSSTPSSHQFVHVINLKLDDTDNNDQGVRRSVTLKIEPKDFSHGDKDGQKDGAIESPKDQKLMFVLNSKQPVKWKVEVSPKFHPDSKQRFWVQSHSVIRFRKRKGRMQSRGRRRRMPSADDEHNFLKWVRLRYKAVTSYSEVDGDKLLFYVGQAEASSSECRLNELKASPYALIAHKNQQPVSGCISTGTKKVLDRPVYVIELLDVPDGGSESEQRVELDIMSASGKKMEHDFYLVLRSPPSLKWVLRTHRVYGWIDVVTNADADLRGIRMHTVALRRELMEASGMDLIHWTEYYVAPVRAYTSVSSANILQLLLPSSDAKSSVAGWEPAGGSLVPKDLRPVNPAQGPGDKPSTDMREHLKHIIKTRCQGGMMEVALPAVLTQELDLPMEQLSLLDGSCRATKNSSHVIFRTQLDQCRTKKITVDDEDVYSNAIVIHASGMVGAILEEELGSGYFDLQANSGSGWMEADGDDSGTTYVDDEDFASHKVEIDVECRLPRSNILDPHRGLDTSRRGGEERGVCDMQVYDDPLFLQRVVNFPHTASTATKVYLQASSPHDPKQHVLMENCWVTRWPSPQHNDQHQTVLIQQGCTRSPGVSWVRYETGGADEETTPERLMIYLDLPHGSYVHCQLARCYKGSSSPGQKCPPDPSDHCNSNVLPNMFPQLLTHSCGIHTIGPIEITDTELNILEDTTRTTKPHHRQGSRRGQGEGHLQQSVIIEGLDSGTVVGIAFAAFAIGILLTGALWFIHTHTGPSKRGMSTVSMVGTSGDVTPNSSSPISA